MRGHGTRTVERSESSAAPVLSHPHMHDTVYDPVYVCLCITHATMVLHTCLGGAVHFCGMGTLAPTTRDSKKPREFTLKQVLMRNSQNCARTTPGPRGKEQGLSALRVLPGSERDQPIFALGNLPNRSERDFFSKSTKRKRVKNSRTLPLPRKKKEVQKRPRERTRERPRRKTEPIGVR